MLKRVIMFMAFILMFFVGMTFPDELPTAREIFDRMKAVNPTLKDFSAEITVELKGTALILPIHLDLAGKYYYKKPDKHKLELKRCPRFLSKYPQIFGWHLPDLEKHKALVKDVILNDTPCWKITLLPIEGRGDIIMEEIWVNKSNYTFPRNLTTYKRDAFLDVNVKYRKEEENFLFDEMKAQFHFPVVKVNATATADYKNYKINIGLSDEFFLTPEEKRKLEEKKKNNAENENK